MNLRRLLTQPLIEDKLARRYGSRTKARVFLGIVAGVCALTALINFAVYFNWF